MKFETIISNRLKLTQECKFKQAFIPKGWACVKIKEFSKELAKEIERGKDV